MSQDCRLPQEPYYIISFDIFMKVKRKNDDDDEVERGRAFMHVCSK